MAHALSRAGPVWCHSMPQRSSAVRVHFGAVPHVASAAARAKRRDAPYRSGKQCGKIKCETWRRKQVHQEMAFLEAVRARTSSYANLSRGEMRFRLTNRPTRTRGLLPMCETLVSRRMPSRRGRKYNGSRINSALSALNRCAKKVRRGSTEQRANFSPPAARDTRQLAMQRR
jgi:hypothetical protein